MELEFVCRHCSIEKYKQRSAELGVTNAECPQCGRAMKKKFVCERCYATKLKDAEFTSTECQDCGKRMTPAPLHVKQKSTRRAESHREDKDKSYVYALVSSENPGMVKIGMTKRDPEKRAEELSDRTGVAMPFIVAYQTETERPKEVESAIHESLSNERINPDREFFEVGLRRAIEVIEQEVEEARPKLEVELPAELYRQFKMKCKKEGQSVPQTVRQWVEKAVEEEEIL